MKINLLKKISALFKKKKGQKPSMADNIEKQVAEGRLIPKYGEGGKLLGYTVKTRRHERVNP